MKAIPKYSNRARARQLGKEKGKVHPLAFHEGPEME